MLKEPVLVLSKPRNEEYAFYIKGKHDSVKTEKEAFELFNQFGGEIVFRDSLGGGHVLTSEADLEKIEQMSREFFGKTEKSNILYEEKYDKPITAAYVFWNNPTTPYVINVANPEHKFYCIEDLDKANLH